MSTIRVFDEYGGFGARQLRRLAAAIPYLDLADGRSFVIGTGAPAAPARMAGVAILAGASSVPVLSGAVVRRLAKRLDRVGTVEVANSAANRATAGTSVAAAIFRHVDERIRPRRRRRFSLRVGWREFRRNGNRPNLAEGPIIVFDAVCILCCANARFVLRHDRAGVFRLASMQGEVGAALYRSFGIDPRDPDTLIVVDGGSVLRDSDAVLAIHGGLGWPWRGALLFRLLPHRLRDPLYRWVARNRYRIFGRRESSWVPGPEHAGRIL